MSLVEKLKTVEHPTPWAGPSGDGLNGGVTQSMLGRYLCCKERFRILVIEGLKPHPRFSAPLDFGTMWHACEEALAGAPGDRHPKKPHESYYWEVKLEECVNGMMAQYPRDIENILHWCSVAQELFPVYVDHWSEHPDVQNRTPLLAEQVFDVPYTLPSGRTVRLRGKWDSVDLVEDPAPNIMPSRSSSIWLQENKTKSGIDRFKITRQLTFDLQTMVYLIALEERLSNDTAHDSLLGKDYGPYAKGVRYNVVRRSAHKTATSMVKKVSEDVEAGRSNEWFDRFNVTVSTGDVKKFKVECLDPVLENLCDDFEWWEWCCDMRRAGVGNLNPFDTSMRHTEFHEHCPRHFRMPFGVYSSLTEGGFGDVDGFLEDGNMAGLTHVTDLFPELSNG